MTRCMDDAPKDGTVVQVTNDWLGRWYDAAYVDDIRPYGDITKRWMVVEKGQITKRPIWPLEWKPKDDS